MPMPTSARRNSAADSTAADAPFANVAPNVPAAWNSPWLAIVLAIACFANSLGNGFAYDDQPIVAHNPHIRDLSDFRAIWLTDWWFWQGADEGLAPELRVPTRDRLYRPLTVFSFALNYAAHGLAPFGFHAVNVALHAIATGLVWELARRLFGNARVAAIASLLFAVHPIHAEAVANVVGRAEVLASVLILLGLLALLPRAGVPGAARIVGAGLAGFLAILAKETAICFPALAMIVLWERLRRVEPTSAGAARAWRTWAIAAAAILLPLGVYFTLRMVALEGHLIRTARPSWIFNPIVESVGIERWIAPFTVLGTYARLIVAPAQLCADYGIATLDPSIGVTLETLFGFVTFALIVWGVLRFRTRPASLALALFVVSYVLISNSVLLIGVTLAERLFYWPSVPVLCVLAMLLDALIRRIELKYPQRLKSAAIVGALGLIALAARSATRAADWSDTPTLFSVDTATRPDNAHLAESYARILLGQAQALTPGPARDAMLERAEALLNRALRVAPRFSHAIQMRGSLHILRNQPVEATRCFELALALDPSDRFSQAWLAQLKDGSAGKQRILELERAASSRPSDVQLQVELIQAHVGMGQYSEALRVCDAARRSFPDDLDLLRAYGEVLAANLQRDDAIRVFRQVLERSPREWTAHVNLANLLAESSPPEALAHARAALEENPNDVRVQMNFAAALANSGQVQEALARYRWILPRLPQSDARRTMIQTRVRELEQGRP